MTRHGGGGDLDARVSEVRERLRGLGYLRNPLESFVAGAGGRGASLRTLLGVSTRLGLVGGALVAAIIWLATLALDPTLLETPRDLALLAAYLVAIYAAGIIAAALLVGGVLVLIARGPGRGRDLGALVQGIGVLAALLTAWYGSVWWRLSAADASDWRALASPVNLFAGTLIVLVALLFGRLARLSAILLLAGDRAAHSVASRRRSREAFRALLVGLGAAGLFFAYIASSSDRSVRREPSTYEVSGPLPPLLVIGVDGLSWGDLIHLTKAGEVPNLAALVARSARAPIPGIVSGSPPELWTTIATGEPATRHGVRTFVLSRLFGMKEGVRLPEDPSSRWSALGIVFPETSLSRQVPVSGATRRRKAFWEIVAERGFATSAVNWWATWPAEAGPGSVVTERAFARLTAGRADPEELARAIHPASLAEVADSLARASTALFAGATLGLPPKESAAATLARAGDLFAAGMTEHAIERGGGDGVFAVYLPGLDILRRQLAASPSGSVPLPALDARVKAIHAHARALDDAVGRLLSALGDSTSVALVTAPGGTIGRQLTDEPGLFALAGPLARSGPTASPMRPEEIAPTLLALLGFPSSREMGGGARADLLAESAIAARPIRAIDSFGERGRTEIPSSATDEEFLERLRSLGYIK